MLLSDEIVGSKSLQAACNLGMINDGCSVLSKAWLELLGHLERLRSCLSILEVLVDLGIVLTRLDR